MYISITPVGTTSNGLTIYEMDVETRAVSILRRLLELLEKADSPEQVESWLDGISFKGRPAGRRGS